MRVRSALSGEKKLSIAALSPTLPDRLMLRTMSPLRRPMAGPPILPKKTRWRGCLNRIYRAGSVEMICEGDDEGRGWNADSCALRAESSSNVSRYKEATLPISAPFLALQSPRSDRHVLGLPLPSGGTPAG
jgi:hypothetical protein